MENRMVRYRLLPTTVANARKLAGTAGACRFVWNHFLAKHNAAYEAFKSGQGEKPSFGFYSFCNEFTELRHSDEFAWLEKYSASTVRQSLNRLSKAITQFVKGVRAAPGFKAKGAARESFDIDVAKVQGGKLHIPKVGWLRIRGSQRYVEGKAKTAVVKKENGKWFAFVCYEVETPESETKPGFAGVDMNAGQVAVAGDDGDEKIIRVDLRLLAIEKRRKHYQRKMMRQQRFSHTAASGKKYKVDSNRRAKTKRQAAKWFAKERRIRQNWAHQTSCELANKYGAVVVEDLHVKQMTAKGGNRKKGLNRVIQRTAWGNLRQLLEYKADELIVVPAAYTSQECNECGHIDKENRQTQAAFVCQKCGHAANADINAAKNILASGKPGGKDNPRCRGDWTGKSRDYPVDCQDGGTTVP